MKLYILGGGPCGLAVADEMIDHSDINFTLLERSDSLGGLAKTVAWKSYGHHDLGPHKIFTLDQNLMKRVHSLIPENQWVTQEKTSRIFLNGHFLNYPPAILSLLKVYGPFVFSKMVLGYIVSMLKSMLLPTKAKTFEDDLKSRVGSGLYQYLFEPIAKKLWRHPSQLDSKLSKGRVQTPSPVEIIKNALGLRQKSEFEALSFLYPKGGLGKLWESIQTKSRPQDCFLMDTEITKLSIEDNKVTAIQTKNLKNQETQSIVLEEGDFVASSLPLPLLAKLSEPSLADELSDSLSYVQSNDLILVFLKLDCKRLFKESWIFVPDAEIAFHRMSEQHAFDESMTSEGSILCCEVMSRPDNKYIEKDDSFLVDLVLDGLEKMGFKDIRKQKTDSKVTRLPQSYPVYLSGFEPHLEKVLQRMDQITNLKTVGRQGSFNYIGTLDAMDIGYGFGRWLRENHVLGDNKNTAQAQSNWSQERERTSLYPVLD